MAVPTMGSTLHLSKIEKEQQHDDYNSSAATASSISLTNLSRGIAGYDAINTNNWAENRPNGLGPHAMSEYYLYDHDIGSYGVTTNSASSVVSGGARLNGNVTNVGQGIGAKGFVWSQHDSSPVNGETNVNTTAVSGTSTGSYYYDLTNRPASTQFWYRAFVTSGDTGAYTYGSVVTFTTASALTSFNHSNGVMKIIMLCGYSTYGNTSYHDGSGSNPAVGDLVWSDSSGSTALAANRYKLGGGSYFEVNSSGAVSSVGIC
tara:strand:+ start:728 stop:1510 length:783 start_codon:yes stop_codon:yes gene_type:complete